MTTSLETMRESLLDVLIANVPDPESRGDNSWITGENGDEGSFPGWPQITVSHAITEEYAKTQGKGTAARRTRPVAFVLMISARTGIQGEQLIDAVEAAIYSNEETLRTAGFRSINVVVGSSGDVDTAENVEVIPVTIDAMA